MGKLHVLGFSYDCFSLGFFLSGWNVFCCLLFCPFRNLSVNFHPYLITYGDMNVVMIVMVPTIGNMMGFDAPTSIPPLATTSAIHLLMRTAQPQCVWRLCCLSPVVWRMHRRSGIQLLTKRTRNTQINKSTSNQV